MENGEYDFDGTPEKRVNLLTYNFTFVVFIFSQTRAGILSY